jgi:uncharacterized protein
MTPILLIFSKFPEPGQVKTRLIPFVGEGVATQLYQRLLTNTLAVAAGLNVSIKLCYGSGSLLQWQEYLGVGYSLHPQVGNDLGSRLAHALETASRSGVKVLMIGCDCPGLTTTVLQAAFDALDTADLVLGPALDGGYYAIGTNHYYSELFQGITWSTATVLSETVAIAESLGLRIAYLETLRDVDRPEDLEIVDRSWLAGLPDIALATMP